MKCLECGSSLDELTNRHLIDCCGLTLQEYALRHCLPLDIIVPEHLLNPVADIADYVQITTPPPPQARLILSAVDAVGMLRVKGDFVEIPGEVRRLNQLLWLLQKIKAYGFHFHQEYLFNDTTHRVVARNCLRARAGNTNDDELPSPDSFSSVELLHFTSVVAGLVSFLSAGYIFIPFGKGEQGQRWRTAVEKEFKVSFVELDPVDERVLFRTETIDDTNCLLSFLRSYINDIPHATEHLYERMPAASVAKELSFDSAHFITDHPGACANMHGGRYNLIVTVRDRIAPYTGFVMDYAYLKAVLKKRVVGTLDHAHLNLVDAALSWRSSTELLSIYVWQRLLDYIPSLTEINLYETENSHCTFSGPTLREWQNNGYEILPSHFKNPQLGGSILRRQSGLSSGAVKLTVVASKKR